jgi:hypothetical protein
MTLQSLAVAPTEAADDLEPAGRHISKLLPEKAGWRETERYPWVWSIVDTLSSGTCVF